MAMKNMATIGVVLIFVLVLTSTSLIPAYAGDDIEFMGDIALMTLSATAVGVTLVQDDREGLLQYSKSLFVTLGTTALLKYSIDEERPNGKAHSFPSAHTSMAFSGATFLQKRYGWKSGIPALITASFVGWSRIESDNHYFKDVVAGAAIGAISSYFFTDTYQEKIVVTPFVGRETYGMLLQTAF